jgi:imidazolonepropionase
LKGEGAAGRREAARAGKAALFRNARIWTPVDGGRPSAGPRQGRVARWEKGALLCRDGLIETIGGEEDVLRSVTAAELSEDIDCGGRCMIPGFVDPHTHICFLRPREGEFLQRLEGAQYLDILKKGGGILSSVEAVRSASEEDLFEATRGRALSCLRLGTTTVEIKSGYGLSTEAELKQLRVIARVGKETPLSVVPTFLGAHAVPAEHRGAPGAYVELLVRETLPAVVHAGLARFCDVFCEKGVFSVAESRKILEAARAAGLGLKLHADEIHDTGGAGLAADLRAVSADHLLAVSDANIARMAEAGTVAVLLPATAFSMRKPYAAARRMIDAGLPIAIATDCNPGSSFTESMPFVFSLAVLQMNLGVAEALVAATLNAAYAVGQGGETGCLAPGRRADFLLLDGETPAILAFHAGVSTVLEVYKGGRLVTGAQQGGMRESG